MNRFKIFSLAILSIFVMAGFALASGIPQVTSPKNYPTVWTEQVYNGSGSDIATAQVVIWDFDTSDSSINDFDDMCPWVATTTTASDPWTAGVTLTNQGINNGDTGTIIIKGPAVCDDGAGRSNTTADDIVGTTTTAGDIAEVSAINNDGAFLGVTIKASASNQGYIDDALIYVDPAIDFDD